MNRILTLIFALALFAGNASADSAGGLHWAAEQNDKEMLRLLLDSGEDVNQVNKWGRTPLHEAARSGRSAGVQMLLAAGADVGAKDKKGLTPLHMAARLKNEGAVRLLLAAGADVGAKNKEGDTPLQYAMRSDFGTDKQVARLLIKAANQAKKAANQAKTAPTVGADEFSVLEDFWDAAAKNKCRQALDGAIVNIKTARSYTETAKSVTMETLENALISAHLGLTAAQRYCK